ncbi:hypothetical protein ACFFSW_20890 [Saccharothrix longispora]|uniref:Uncharacterized protein n=1 Tax=Saccharothrix longispora TaxID=33920 RepID=A0ABU1Q2Y6_9PSEU|nr:hypothetical protein [Saccharothrix longispora]MDR6597263.1 hypothetical protein [Saccharothrix longispora]
MMTRADMADQLQPGSSTPIKTFVIEAHAEDPLRLLEEVVGRSNLEVTADAYLYRAHLDGGVLWVDQLDGRFWSIHTDMSTKQAHTFLRKEVENRRELDWMWLPSEHLRKIWPNTRPQRVVTTFDASHFQEEDVPAKDLKVHLSGRGATQLLDYIAGNVDYRYSVSFQSSQSVLVDPDLGSIVEGVNRQGRFAVHGDSFDFHLQVVQAVVRRYKNLVQLCEARAIDYASFGEADGGGTMSGGAILVRFSRTITDLSAFVAELFSARTPYRLWGVPRLYDEHAEVDAVDLHVGQSIRMDFGADWLRVYLDKGSCGNTVARLVCNLQHTFDGALSFADPVLDAALRGISPALPRRP